MGSERVVRLAILSESAFNTDGLREMALALGHDVEVCSQPSAAAATVGIRQGASVIVLDIGAGDPSRHRELCRHVARAGGFAVGVCCAGPDPPSVSGLFADGLAGYISLARHRDHFGALLRSLDRGEMLITGSADPGGRGRTPQGVSGMLRQARLTHDDAAILLGMGSGFQDRKIGRRLGMSEDNVRHKVAALIHREELSTRFQLGVWARDRGLLSPPRKSGAIGHRGRRRGPATITEPVSIARRAIWSQPRPSAGLASSRPAPRGARPIQGGLCGPKNSLAGCPAAVSSVARVRGRRDPPARRTCRGPSGHARVERLPDNGRGV